MSKPTITPRRWRPPPAPELAGRWQRNRVLDALEVLPVPGDGPEDVVVLPDGSCATGLVDGRIVALDVRNGGEHRVVGQVPGRPLGLEALPDGTVLVCDAAAGLLRLTPSGLEVLVDRVDGRRLVLTNNATVGPDGAIYFTESSTRFPLEHYRADLIEHSGSGSLFRRDPAGEVTRLLSGLTFANGVTMHPDGSSVLVAETGGYAIHRVYVSGPRQGQTERFVPNLPGHPDNLSTSADGTVWVAMAALRNPVLDRLLPMPPIVRKLAWRLPESLQPQPSPTAFVLGFDGSGQVISNLQGHDGTFPFVTGVREHDGALYLGSLYGRHIGVHRLG